jgi:hypothetical protein
VRVQPRDVVEGGVMCEEVVEEVGLKSSATISLKGGVMCEEVVEEERCLCRPRMT